MEQLNIGYSIPVGESPLNLLAARVGREWANLVAAEGLAIRERQKLQSALTEFDSADSSVVVFGSLGRDEFTPGSDIDWTLLVEGLQILLISIPLSRSGDGSKVWGTPLRDAKACLAISPSVTI
jgi:Nucleotidyltransferase domain